MAAYKGPYYGASASSPPLPPRSWEQVPGWHWRSWFGYRMRISVGFTAGRPPYSYRSHNHHARVVLEAQAAGVPLQFYDPPGAAANGPYRRPKR